MNDIGNYRELFLNLFCMEFKLRKCFFPRKFNDKKIISLRQVEYHFRESFDRLQNTFDRLQNLSRCGRCEDLPLKKNNNKKYLEHTYLHKLNG